MITFDGLSLTIAEIVEISRGGAAITLAPGGRERAQASFDYAALVAMTRPVYGRSTGVGANRLVSVDDPAAATLNLLRSHATSAGPPRAPERVRAMLAVRANQLAVGGSGVNPRIIDALLAMLRADALPLVRELGSIGTGDLSALATTALALLGEAPTSAPLPARCEFGPGDGLGFLSSNAATIADAALAVQSLQALATVAVAVAALSFAAVDGNVEPFIDVVDLVTPFEGARLVNRMMRNFVAGARPAPRIQDPFGLRTLPQVHGALLDALERLNTVVGRLANAPSENPVLIQGADVAHHGGFHAAYLAQALDAVRLAIAQSAQLSLARLTMLNEPALTGRPAFLADGTPGASGTMVVEYVAASALGELRSLATPASLQTVTLSRGVEEDASFAGLAAVQSLATRPFYRTILAAELLTALRAVRQRELAPPGLAGLLTTCARLPTEMSDRDLTADIAIAESVLDELLPV